MTTSLTHPFSPFFLTLTFLPPVFKNICQSVNILCGDCGIAQLSGALYKTVVTGTVTDPMSIFFFFLSYKGCFSLEWQYVHPRYKFLSSHYNFMWPFWLMRWKQKLLGRHSGNQNCEADDLYGPIFAFPFWLLLPVVLWTDGWFFRSHIDRGGGLQF